MQAQSVWSTVISAAPGPAPLIYRVYASVAGHVLAPGSSTAPVGGIACWLTIIGVRAATGSASTKSGQGDCGQRRKSCGEQ